MSGKRAAAEAGFTLLEVVVAVAIAGLALVGLFQAGSGGLFAVDTAARAEEALQRAQSHLAAVGRDAALVEGDSSGDDGGGYRWRLQVQPAAQRQGVAADGVTPQNADAVLGSRSRSLGSRAGTSAPSRCRPCVSAPAAPAG